MEKYKLTYFDIRGIAEPIRWIFLVSNNPFEDNRIPTETWPDVKSKIPWGQVPFLEIDGTIKLTQSVTIGRYLAKKFSLVPNDDLQAARCDEIVDAVNDLRIIWRPFLLANISGQAEKAEELKKSLEEQEFPRFLARMEELVKSSGGDYILGDTFYWADFYLANYLEIWEESMGSTLLDPYPSLKTQKSATFSIPQIAKWILERPKTFV